jgi:hypothetical protein
LGIFGWKYHYSTAKLGAVRDDAGHLGFGIMIGHPPKDGWPITKKFKIGFGAILF